MRQLLLKLALPLIVVIVTIFAQSALVFAAPTPCPSGGSKSQVLGGVGETGGNCDDDGVNNAIKAAVNILSYIAGAAAVIMLVVAGVKYTTSGGDSNAVSSAKTTLIYALVGLAIAAMAQAIVHFVLNALINGTVSGS